MESMYIRNAIAASHSSVAMVENESKKPNFGWPCLPSFVCWLDCMDSPFLFVCWHSIWTTFFLFGKIKLFKNQFKSMEWAKHCKLVLLNSFVPFKNVIYGPCIANWRCSGKVRLCVCAQSVRRSKWPKWATHALDRKGVGWLVHRVNHCSALGVQAVWPVLCWSQLYWFSVCSAMFGHRFELFAIITVTCCKRECWRPTQLMITGWPHHYGDGTSQQCNSIQAN